MIGTFHSSKKDVTVVGGGIAGLLAAYFLDKNGYEVTLCEAESRFGGLIATLKSPMGLVEKAAHSLYATPPVLELCADLGVELVELNPGARARYVWRDGKMRRFPLRLGECARVFFRAYFVRSKRNVLTRTIEEWALRYLGHPALNYLVVPFLRGIYGARPSELTLEAAFPSLKIPAGHSLLSYQLAKRWRPSLRSNKLGGRMVAPKQGMEDLVQKLEKRLAERLGSRLKKNLKIDRLPKASNVVLAVPAAPAGELVKNETPLLHQKLIEVPYAPLITATVFAPRSEFTKPPEGVGVLVPEVEPPQCLGILFTSSSFDGRVKDAESHLSLTVLLGGTSRPEMIGWPDSKIVDAVENELQAILGYRGKNPSITINRHPQAIPVYGPKLEDAWAAARDTWCKEPGHILFGNYTGQVSIRGMIEVLSNLLHSVKTAE